MRGRSDLVTGASSGLGRAIAVALAARGASVGVGTFAEDPHDAEETVRLARSAGGRALAVAADVRDSAQMDEACGRPPGSSAAWTAWSPTRAGSSGHRWRLPHRRGVAPGGRCRPDRSDADRPRRPAVPPRRRRGCLRVQHRRRSRRVGRAHAVHVGEGGRDRLHAQRRPGARPAWRAGQRGDARGDQDTAVARPGELGGPEGLKRSGERIPLGRVGEPATWRRSWPSS